MSGVEWQSEIGEDVQVGRALKALVVLAAVAAVLGGGLQGGLAGAATLVGGYVVLKVWQALQEICSNTVYISMKAKYMEKRMDVGGGQSGDICRHMAQLLEEFVEELSSKWWLERKLRAVFEAYQKAHAGMELKDLLACWRLLCCEVKLRGLRDVVMERIGLKDGVEDPAEEKRTAFLPVALCFVFLKLLVKLGETSWELV